jgi:hypothetical protein
LAAAQDQSWQQERQGTCSELLHRFSLRELAAAGRLVPAPSESAVEPGIAGNPGDAAPPAFPLLTL